jgi:RNA polymerase sigma factor (TIGR02999 family)
MGEVLVCLERDELPPSGHPIGQKRKTRSGVSGASPRVAFVDVTDHREPLRPRTPRWAPLAPPYNREMSADAETRQEATRILRSIASGAGGDSGALLDLVYEELRELAGLYLARERSDHTLQPTALVHEAWLRLIDQEVEWEGRAHFIGVAAQGMRRILVDHARGVNRVKRGAGWKRVELHPDLAEGEGASLDLVSLDRALAELSEQSERLGRLVELRFFGGLEMEAIAELLGVSERTVRRDWRFARAWLTERLAEMDA